MIFLEFGLGAQSSFGLISQNSENYGWACEPGLGLEPVPALSLCSEKCYSTVDVNFERQPTLTTSTSSIDLFFGIVSRRISRTRIFIPSEKELGTRDQLLLRDLLSHFLTLSHFRFLTISLSFGLLLHETSPSLTLTLTLSAFLCQCTHSFIMYGIFFLSPFLILPSARSRSSHSPTRILSSALSLSLSLPLSLSLTLPLLLSLSYSPSLTLSLSLFEHALAREHQRRVKKGPTNERTLIGPFSESVRCHDLFFRFFPGIGRRQRKKSLVP